MNRNLGRRKFLAAAGGGVLTLPFVRSLPSYAQDDAKRYLILVFSGNGVVRHTWGADKLGPERGNIAFRESLRPLAPFKEYVTIVNGLRNKAADDIGGTHEGGMQGLWTSGRGPSIDQLVGPALGGVRPSLELRVMSNDDETNRTPNNRMIFDASGVPIDPREDAASAAAQLFAGIGGSAPDPAVARNDAIRREVFAQIAGELTALKPRLCAEDQTHLEALRSGWDTVQQRLANAKSLECSAPAVTSATGNYYRDRSRNMIEVLLMSLACDLTRTASLQFSQGLSNLVPSFLSFEGTPINEKHHDLSHKAPAHETMIQYDGSAPRGFVDHSENPTPDLLQTNRVVWGQLTTINAFYAEEFAYLLKRLSEMPVAGGKTLLDQCLVVWGTEIDNGQSHDHFSMPFVLAGGAGGTLNRGTVVEYPRAVKFGPETNLNPPGLRYHADLLLTIANLLGVPLSSIGDAEYATGPLTELISA